MAGRARPVHGELVVDAEVQRLHRQLAMSMDQHGIELADRPTGHEVVVGRSDDDLLAVSADGRTGVQNMEAGPFAVGRELRDPLADGNVLDSA